MADPIRETTDLTAAAWRACRMGCAREWGDPCAQCLHAAARERLKERDASDGR